MKSKLPVVTSLVASSAETTSSVTAPLKLAVRTVEPASEYCAWVISGASFVPVMVMTTSWDAVPPSLSLAVIV